MARIVRLQSMLIDFLMLVRHWWSLASMFVETDSMKALRQVYRVINMLRCQKEIRRMWMYSKVGKCDDALPMSRLQVVQPPTCITRPSLRAQIGYAWWEAQLVLRPAVPCLQVISWVGGPGLCIVRILDARFLFRVASEGFPSDTIASCAWYAGRNPDHPIHKCSLFRRLLGSRSDQVV
jgi:hypothetical protein